ncbi:unnamed protein product [Scytosiphon promiscuus]
MFIANGFYLPAKAAGSSSTVQKQADLFSRLAEDPLANADPFADLVGLSFTKAPKQAYVATPRDEPATAATSASRPNASPPAWGEVAPATTGSLAAEKRKSQESRLKRDTFLHQMSSFLEGLESSTPAEVVPPEPSVSLATAESYTTAAFPPSIGGVAGKQATWSAAMKDVALPSSSGAYSSGAAGPKSSLMQEGLFDPFLPKEVSPEVDEIQGGLRGVLTEAPSGGLHPQGSLFDDDYVGVEETGLEDTATNGQSRLRGNLVASGSAGPSPQRVAPSPLPLSAPSHDVRAPLSQGRSSNKAKPSRGLDLEEVRRRTSLLSGENRARALAPAQSLPPETAGASRPAPVPSGEVPPHPLYASSSAAPVDPLFPGSGSGGNYFNEDLLRARQFSSGSGSTERRTGNGTGQGAWGGDALKDSAGNFLITARDGARTLLKDAKAGVDAVGASWQGSRDESKPYQYASAPRGLRQEDAKDGGEYELLCVCSQVTFGEGRLGFTLFREDAGPGKGKGVVCKVHPGSTAHSLGVREGDTVSGVNKHRYNTYDQVMEALPKLPRPVLITFTRGGPEQSIERIAAAKRASSPPEGAAQGGGHPLEWLSKLNPFDKRRRGEEDEQRAEWKPAADSKLLASTEYGSPGEVFARGLRGGVFSWSYYGTSDGIEANTRDTYTEHVMRCKWGTTKDAMHSWMVARRYREFDALDLDLRDAYPDRRDSLPRLPPKEFFKMAPDVVERRTKGLEMYMTTLIRRFPDMLESSHLDRFLTISERLSALQPSNAPGSNSQTLSYKNVGANGSSSNVFPGERSVGAANGKGRSSSLVGTDYILDLMTSEEAWRLSQARHASPVDISFAEDLVNELEDHISRISPDVNILGDERLYELVARCQKAWPGLKSSAITGDSAGTLLPRIVQCDENMERAFENLRALLASRGYIGGAP